MPGICLISSGVGSVDIEQQLERMMESLGGLPFHATRRWVSPNGEFAIAQVQVDVASPSVEPSADSPWVHGDLEGGFTSVRYDGVQRRLAIENDRFGMMPLYHAKLGNMLLAATELKAILAHPAFAVRLDPQGLADLLTFGFVLGEKTTVDGVRCLPGGARLEFSAAEGAVRIERTWDIRNRLGGPYVRPAEALPRISELFQSAVARCFESGRICGLSLSGGLDSRTLLAVVDHRRHRVQTLTLDVPGGGDQRLASEIAHHTNGIENHHFLINDETFFARWPEYLRETVFLSDGLFFDEACVMMRTVGAYRELGVDRVLRGHGGELARMHQAYELRCNRHVHACRNRGALVDQLFKQMSIGLNAEALERLLTPGWAELVRGGARASLERAFTQIDASWHVVDQLTCLYAEEYLRRQCVPSLAQLRSRVDVALPYLDADYAAAILELPPETRLTTQVHRRLLADSNPALLRICNANTGAPAGAADWRHRLSQITLTLLRRWFRYERFPRYVDLSAWLAGPLREPVNAILLDPRTLDRGLFCADTIRALCQPASRTELAEELILLAVYVEQWHRLFVDD